MIYASAEQIIEELTRFPDLALPDDLTALIAAAERAVDHRLGGSYPVDPITGLKLDPDLLTPAQRSALVRAVAAAVGHLSELGVEQALGLDDYLPNLLTQVQGSGLAAAIDEQVAGLGLIAWSGCAAPTLDVLDAT